MAWWQLCSGRIYILSEQHDKEAVELYWSRNTSGSTAQKFKWWSLPDFVRRNPNLAWGGCVVLVLCMVIFGIYGIGFDATQFIYNQF